MPICFKVYFIYHICTSISAIIYKLGNKSNNYYRMHNISV